MLTTTYNDEASTNIFNRENTAETNELKRGPRRERDKLRGEQVI